MDLLLATRNGHKTRELEQILGPEFRVWDLTNHPEIPEIDERGATFEENAILKALAVSRNLPGIVIGDDSGLEVDALGGAPGILSARYAGKRATDQANVDKLLGALGKADQRSARFRCLIALAQNGELLGAFEGAVEGTIVDLPRGKSGFGYDPVFKPDGFDRTFAELPIEIKNQISHRARAAKKLVEFLRRTRPGC